MGSTINQKAIEKGQSLRGDIVRFILDSDKDIPLQEGKTYQWHKTTQD